MKGLEVSTANGQCMSAVSVGGPSQESAAASGKRTFATRIYAISDNPGRLIPMEGLRGLAVLMVFFVHVHALFGVYARQSRVLWPPSQFLGIVGNAGVDLFFVLSGYLIYAALLRNRTSVFGFLHRRLERIYPTFLAVFAFYVALSFMVPQASKLHEHQGIARATYLVQNLLLLPGVFDIKPMITVSWSLSYEVFFYIGAALLIRSARMWAWKPSHRILFFVALWCGYLAICFTLPKSHVRALMFIVGIGLYEMLSFERFRRLLSGPGELAAIILVLGSLVFAYLMDVRQDLFSFLPGWLAGRNPAPGIPVYQGPYKTMVLSGGMFWCVAYSFAFDGRLKRLFSWAPLRYLGNMSYSYYLIHGVTLQGVALACAFLATRFAPGPALFILALLVGSLATSLVSTVLFIGIEKPFSLQRKRVRPCVDSRREPNA